MDNDIDTNMDTGEGDLNHQTSVSLPLLSPSLSLVSESPGILSDVLDNDTIRRLKLLRYEKKRKFLLEEEHKGDGKGDAQEIDVNLNSDSLNNMMDIDVDADMCNDTSNHQEFLGDDRSTATFNLIDVETVRSIEGSDLGDEFRATRAPGEIRSSTPSSSVVPSNPNPNPNPDEFRATRAPGEIRSSTPPSSSSSVVPSLTSDLVEEFRATKADGDVSSSTPSSFAPSHTSEVALFSPLIGAAPLFTTVIEHEIKNTDKITTEPLGVSLITTGTELGAHSNEAEVDSVAALDAVDRDEELRLLKRRERYLKVPAFSTYIVSLNKVIIYSLTDNLLSPSCLTYS
jgi:hypothetical protein